MVEICTWDMFDYAVNQITNRTKCLVKSNDIVNIYGIPRGGLPLAVSLSHRLNIPLVKNQSEINKRTLICDDISDGGNTLKQYRETNFIVTIYTTRHTKTVPNYSAYVRGKSWVKFPWELEDSLQ